MMTKEIATLMREFLLGIHAFSAIAKSPYLGQVAGQTKKPPGSDCPVTWRYRAYRIANYDSSAAMSTTFSVKHKNFSKKGRKVKARKLLSGPVREEKGKKS